MSYPHGLLDTWSNSGRGSAFAHGVTDMKKTFVALAALLFASPAFALEPIPGSITYGGGPHSKLQKSPIGSTLVHRFRNDGNEYEERYVLQPDRSLKLISRSRRSDR